MDCCYDDPASCKHEDSIMTYFTDNAYGECIDTRYSNTDAKYAVYKFMVKSAGQEYRFDALTDSYPRDYIYSELDDLIATAKTVFMEKIKESMEMDDFDVAGFKYYVHVDRIIETIATDFLTENKKATWTTIYRKKFGIKKAINKAIIYKTFDYLLKTHASKKIADMYMQKKVYLGRCNIDEMKSIVKWTQIKPWVPSIVYVMMFDYIVE